MIKIWDRVWDDLDIELQISIFDQKSRELTQKENEKTLWQTMDPIERDKGRKSEDV